MSNEKGSDGDSSDGSSDISVSDDEIDSSEELPASATRVARELLEGTRTDLESTRPPPTRRASEPAPKPKPKITQVNSLFNYVFVKKIPIGEVVSNKKEKRKEPEKVAEPEQVKVLSRPLVSLGFNIILFIYLFYRKKPPKRRNANPRRFLFRKDSMLFLAKLSKSLKTVFTARRARLILQMTKPL